MESESEVSTQHKRGQSSSSAEQRQAAKRARFESPEELSSVARKRFSEKRESATGAEETEPTSLETPGSSSGVVMPSDVLMGETMTLRTRVVDNHNDNDTQRSPTSVDEGPALQA